MVGSIAATDFSSVAGLGALLPPGAAACCLPCMRLCCCCPRNVWCALLPSAVLALPAAFHTASFPVCLSADSVVRQLREMVLLPMQYPELFEGMGLQPPR